MRYLVTSIALHLVLISFCWVGFSVPIGPDKNSFTYWGALSAGGQAFGRSVWSSVSSANSDSVMRVGETSTYDVSEGMGESSSTYFSQWLKMREEDKPHVRLGF